MNRLDLSIEIPSDFVILLKYNDQINCYTFFKYWINIHMQMIVT
jgi:hypothetical protein